MYSAKIEWGPFRANFKLQQNSRLQTWLQRYTEEDNNENDDEFDDMMNDNDNNDSGEHGSDE